LDAANTPAATLLKGTIAIANCRVVYARFQELFHGPAFAALAAKGAQPQRVLWASTSTKDPHYRDTLYVEELVGPETVDTIPPATLTAFEDHGVVRGDTLTQGLPEARQQLERAKAAGIDLGAVCDNLQTEGVSLFATSYAVLLQSLAAKKVAIFAERIDPLSWDLGADGDRVAALASSWQADRVNARFWKQDPTLWPAAPASDVAERMGWLRLPEMMHDQVAMLEAFSEGLRSDGFRYVVVLGMGGSSLAPDVLRRVFGSRPGFPELLVLDSTHPDAVAAVQQKIDPAHTLFLVSSKSGTTTEPLSFYRYFREVVRASGVAPGPSFAAVTDPGTPLAQLAHDDGFRAIFLALPTVGGRYSALTMFGLVPAAAIGVDVRGLLDRAWTMAEACAPSVPVAENPGLSLGTVLGELATHGKDKLTFYAGGGFVPFPIWVEQLVAESTGKIGKGIVPVVDEPRISVEQYGADRLFVEFQESGDLDGALASHVSRLEAAGFPVVRVRLPDRLAIGEEFFRWEMAVASSGSILGINPYDQPDVEFAKELARKAMAQPTGGGPAAGVTTIRSDARSELEAAAREWLGSARPGDYVGIQAYLAPSDETTAALDQLRRQLLERLRLATTFGYGPRFLHSTGQLHKGGPNTGLFLQLIDTPGHDLTVPGAGFTFGELIRAQSLGDYQALRQKDRRILRVDLGSDVRVGLQRLVEALNG
jgi:transaldolase / glucose-6-phosphate isomerase